MRIDPDHLDRPVATNLLVREEPDEDAEEDEENDHEEGDDDREDDDGYSE